MKRKTKKKTARKRTAMKPVDGYVWCDKRGEVHDDTLDPYDEGPLSDEDRRKGFEDPRCSPSDHRKVYARQP